MTSIPQDRSSVTLEGPFGAAELRQFCAPGRFDSLSLTKQPLITARIAKELSALESVKTLWLWCPITRTAMRHVISMPDLEILDILRFRGPGALENFSGATALKEVRCNGGMSEADLLAIAELPNVEELAAQWSALTLRALEAILGMPKLHRLDLEATPLDDEMAKALAKSSNIDMLEIGATRVTAAGLRDICTMSQLHYLDIWQLDIREADLDLLAALPNLEYLSIGGYDGQTALTAKGVIPRLAKLPSLKRLWLDGIALSSSEMAVLEERYEFVQN